MDIPFRLYRTKAEVDEARQRGETAMTYRYYLTCSAITLLIAIVLWVLFV